MQKKTVLIIGAGPAGCAAAIQSKRLGLEPILVDSSGRTGGLLRNAHCIENYPGLDRPLDGPAFVRRLERQLNHFNLTVRQGVCSEWARKKGLWQVTLDDGSTPTGAALVLATGTVPNPGGLANERELSGRHLYYEVEPLLQSNPKQVLIVGGGEAAFDYALSLAKQGCHTTICIRSDRHKAGPRLEALVDHEELVAIKLHTRLVDVTRSVSSISATLQSPAQTVRVQANAILVACGRTSSVPAAHPDARSLTPEASGKAATGLTIAPGLYIAGDARLGALGQAGIAVGDGLHAAMLAQRYLRGQV